jgi:hypothetical protein
MAGNVVSYKQYKTKRRRIKGDDGLMALGGGLYIKGPNHPE